MEENKKKEYYAVVMWKDAEGKSHIVGSLAYFEGKYYFKYEESSLKGAREKNFTDIAAFNEERKIYISENSLFNFFKMRVPEKVQEKPEAMEELIRSKGKKTGDDISVMELPKVYRPALKAEMKRIEKDQKEAMENNSRELEMY